MFIKKFIQAVVLVYLYSQMVLCKAPVLDKVTSIPKTGKSPETVIELYSYKTGRYLKILNKDITANADRNDTHALLLMGSDHKGTYIKGYVSGKFICFTKKGELKSRHKGRKKLCRFKEDVDASGPYRLASVFNTNWKIGFDDDGQPVLGSEAWPNLITDDRFNFFKHLRKPSEVRPIYPYIINDINKVKKVIDTEDHKSSHPRKAGGVRQNSKKRRRRRSTTRAGAKLTTARQMLEVKPTTGSVLPIR